MKELAIINARRQGKKHSIKSRLKHPLGGQVFDVLVFIDYRQNKKWQQKQRQLMYCDEKKLRESLCIYLISLEYRFNLFLIVLYLITSISRQNQ